MEYLHSDRNKNHPWVIFNQFLHSRSPHDCDFTLQESNLGDVKEPGFPYILVKLPGVSHFYEFSSLASPRGGMWNKLATITKDSTEKNCLSVTSAGRCFCREFVLKFNIKAECETKMPLWL